jgi:hypothetical protein
MNTSAEVHRPTGTIEHDGMSWKPRRGSTATSEEFIAARSLWIDLHADARWNPWVLDDRASDLDRAGDVIDQWARAEPNFRRLTLKQWDVRMARWNREFSAERNRVEERRERDRARYDPEREAARLALLEHQSRLDYELGEVGGLHTGTRFPGMADARRAAEIADLDTQIAGRQAEVERLAAVVGDPEDVIDSRGWLPQDRRELMLTIFSSRRYVEVRELRPQLTPDGMCSECATPAARHGWCTPPSEGPCPAWPRWAARVQKARQMMATFLREARPTEPPQQPKPRPLAVVPSGRPIADVLARLTEIQTEYPDVEVRRGRANRWEIWAAAAPADAVARSHDGRQ